MSMIAVNIFASIVRSPFGQWVIGRLFFSTISLIGMAWVIKKLENTYSFDVDIRVAILFSALLVVGIVFFNVWKIGNFILKHTFIALGIFSLVCLAVFKYKFNLGVYQPNTFFASLTISFLLGLAGVFNLRRKLFVSKSLAEIDRLGNGDTYEKGRQFEEYIAQLYTALGYPAETTTELRKKGQLPGGIQKRGGSGEQGVDVMFFDHVKKERVIVQCKHYSSKISNSAIQEIVAAMPLYEAQRGIVVTNQHFTEPAKELALVNGIILVDREELGRMIEYVSTLKKAA